MSADEDRALMRMALLMHMERGGVDDLLNAIETYTGRELRFVPLDEDAYYEPVCLRCGDTGNICAHCDGMGNYQSPADGAFVSCRYCGPRGTGERRPCPECPPIP